MKALLKRLRRRIEVYVAGVHRWLANRAATSRWRTLRGFAPELRELANLLDPLPPQFDPDDNEDPFEDPFEAAFRRHGGHWHYNYDTGMMEWIPYVPKTPVDLAQFDEDGSEENT